MAAFSATADGQLVIDSPPTVIPYQGGSSYFLENGAILNAYEGAQIHARLSVQEGTLNLFGAELSQGVGAGSGAVVNIYDGNISGGITQEYFMSTGSTTTIRGGRFSGTMLKQIGATLIIEGVDFALDGEPVPGLVSPGDETSVIIPEETLFTGVLSNGAPFTFDRDVASGDRLFGEVILRQSARPVGPAEINVPSDPMPPGVLPGQTLNVQAGATLPEAMNAAPGSVVNFEGGEAGLFELYRAEVNVNSGNVWRLQGYANSTIRINGGAVTGVSDVDDSTVIVNGGTLGSLSVAPGNHIEINGGTIERLRFSRIGAEAMMRGGTITHEVFLSGGATFHVLGGTIERTLRIPSGDHIIVSGGTVASIGHINTLSGAELTLRGRAFTLDGQPIPGLSRPGDSLILTDRPDQTLNAILADGLPLNIYVGTVFQQLPVRDRISPASTLRLILVPEPATLAISLAIFIAGALIHCQQRTDSRSEQSS